MKSMLHCHNLTGCHGNHTNNINVALPSVRVIPLVLSVFYQQAAKYRTMYLLKEVFTTNIKFVFFFGGGGKSVIYIV